MNKVEILKVNKLVFEYILSLEDEEIKKLLSEEKILSLVNNKVKNKKESKEKVKAGDKKLEEALKSLNLCSTKDEAFEYLNKNKFTVDELKIMAKKAEIFVKSRSKKVEVIDKLVEGTVGVKIKMKILQQG